MSSPNIKIWVDADACPKAIKEILFRVSKRTGLAVVLVANQPLRTPPSPQIESIIVPGGLDEADDYIVENARSGDLVVTDDIPLAGRVIENGNTVITPRGKILDEKNIGEQLSLRNFMDEVRSSGVETGGPSPFNKKDREGFANALNGLLTTIKS